MKIGAQIIKLLFLFPIYIPFQIIQTFATELYHGWCHATYCSQVPFLRLIRIFATSMRGEIQAAVVMFKICLLILRYGTDTVHNL